jgi:hypothetical protein
MKTFEIFMTIGGMTVLPIQADMILIHMMHYHTYFILTLMWYKAFTQSGGGKAPL